MSKTRLKARATSTLVAETHTAEEAILAVAVVRMAIVKINPTEAAIDKRRAVIVQAHTTKVNTAATKAHTAEGINKNPTNPTTAATPKTATALAATTKSMVAGEMRVKSVTEEPTVKTLMVAPAATREVTIARLSIIV